MCIISCRLPRNWRKTWSDFSGAIGSGNLVNVRSNRRRPNANAVRMNSGASQGQARSTRRPEQFFARYGNGERKRREVPVHRHFTFYKTATFLKRRKVSLQDVR